MRLVLLAVAALLLAAPAQAKPKPVTPTSTITYTADPATSLTVSSDPSICGNCDGGYANCGTVTIWTWDGGYNNLAANYHWCFNGVWIWDNYGWADNNTCGGICSFGGYDYNYDFSYGHRDKAHWDLFGWTPLGLHITTYAEACVQVDQYGGYWGC